MLELAVLGTVEARVDGALVPVGGRRQVALLSALLCRRDRVIPASALAEAIWGESGRRSNLQVYVHRLRRSLDDPARVEFRPPGYRLVLADAAYDVARFQSLAAQGAAALDDGEPDRAVAIYDTALACWRGEPFAGVEGGQLVDAERDRLLQLHTDVREGRVEAMLAAGRPKDAAPDAADLAATHPFRERVHLLRLEALRRSGRRAEALVAYRQMSDLFSDELGVEPSRPLKRLHQRIKSDGAEPDDVAETGPPAAALAARATELMRRGDHPAAMTLARRAGANELVGVCMREQGRLDDAYAQLTLALASAVASADVAAEARALHLLAIVERERGRHEPAARLLDRADDIHRDLGDEVHQACMPLSRAELRLRAGEPVAVRLAERGLETCQDMGLDFGIAYGARLLGQAALDARRPTEALPLLARAARVSRSCGAPFAFAVTLFNLGRAHASLGHHNDARQVWRRSAGLFERIGHAGASQRIARHIGSLT